MRVPPLGPPAAAGADGDRRRLRRPGWGAAAAVALGLLSLVGSRPAGSEPATPRRPHVVLVSIDTLRPDALRAYSASARENPNFDALTARSTVFTQAVSTAAWTLPAQASLFTGLYPDRHGATDRRLRLRDGVPTLAELLAGAGYETVAFTDGGFVSSFYHLDRGFQRFNTTGKPALLAVPVPRNGMPSTPRGRELFERGIAYLEHRRRTSEDPPLFLFLHTYAVHDYYRVGIWAAREVGSDFQGWKHYRDCLVGRPPCTAKDWDLLRRLYALEVDRADEALGRLSSTLQVALGDRPTIFVITSDHGEGFAPAAGVVHHGGYLHPDIVRIPLLISGPGVGAAVRTAPVSLADVMPTVLRLAGVEPPAGLDGRDLGLLAPSQPSARQPARDLLALEHASSWAGPVNKASERVRTTPLSAAVIGDGGWYVAGAEEELFDWSLLNGTSRLTTRAPSRYREWIRARRRLEAPRAAMPASDELERELKSLGYL